mmetsp:Transcript_28065/g.65582  ORF Transcript_28065/g.65582 Transcript_28065/m.65582 type:complete len:286 (+) Transcript_28065:58-915(+)|eukprot:CAMPEP_0171091432 /NCGR_PEP_ID=MMETSP0766_2-20121228/33276_1 /TAXON_ID=439317 /ORGANISM="Gambierdiscus australes, Strain CAWD 149" /LENGTH=285 /DNA_ID=CAMNT_0011549537 /DNA_START=60 /DNA_END=917 /DNA_ORIENTATION=+
MARLRFTLAIGIAQSFLLHRAVGTQMHANSEQAGALRSSPSSSEESILSKQSAPEQSLMICNAYTGAEALEILEVGSQKKLSKSPLAYKDCANFHLRLREGDQLEFRTGNLSVGVFKAMGLPRSAAALLLIAHRRNSKAANAAFESHAFADLGSAQLVVIDVYRGKSSAKVRIADDIKRGKAGDKTVVQRMEDLKFNSIVQVKPGDYQILLQDTANDKSVATADLHVADQQGKFVVLRIGNELATDKAGAAFPQELVVRQQSSAEAAHPLFLVVTALAGLFSLHC